MAQASIHFATGMLAGTIWQLPRLRQHWQQRTPLAKTIAHWIFASYALGAYATLPSILWHTAGIDIRSAWWANIFLLYPLIEKLPLPSIALGELCCGTIFACQYSLMLLAIYRLNRA
jgi:hypothetical protein